MSSSSASLSDQGGPLQPLSNGPSLLSLKPKRKLTRLAFLKKKAQEARAAKVRKASLKATPSPTASATGDENSAAAALLGLQDRHKFPQTPHSSIRPATNRSTLDTSGTAHTSLLLEENSAGGAASPCQEEIKCTIDVLQRLRPEKVAAVLQQANIPSSTLLNVAATKAKEENLSMAAKRALAESFSISLGVSTRKRARKISGSCCPKVLSQRNHEIYEATGSDPVPQFAHLLSHSKDQIPLEVANTLKKHIDRLSEPANAHVAN